MPTTDLHYLGLIEVGQQNQAKKLSPVEVTKAMLGRIGQLDGQLKSYAYVMGEAALTDAAAAEKEIAFRFRKHLAAYFAGKTISSRYA